MPSIADYWVEIHTTGVEEVAAKLTKTEKKLIEADKAAATLLGRFKQFGSITLGKIGSEFGTVFKSMAEFPKAGETITNVFSGLKTTMLAAQASILGVVTAGFAGTVEGNRLAWQFRQLSMEVAGIFIPAVESAISWLSRIRQWFASLSGEQQNNILKWALWTAGVTAGIKALQTFGLLAPLTALGLKGISVALTAISANPLLAVVAAMGALTIGTLAWVASLGKAKTLSEKIAEDMKKLKESDKLEKSDIMNSRVAAVSKMAAFNQLSKDEQMKVLEKEKRAAQDRLATAEGWAKDKDEFKKNKAEGKVGEQAAGKASRDIEIADRLIEQLKKEGKVDVDKLGKDDHRRTTMAAPSGFENISSAYTRIAQAAINQFDPAKAAAKAEGQREQMIQAIKDNKPKANAPALAGV